MEKILRSQFLLHATRTLVLQDLLIGTSLVPIKPALIREVSLSKRED